MIEWANANQGIIELVGLFLIIPTAILSDKILSAQKRSAFRKELKRMLVKELWLNLNYVAQIETSYENNFHDIHNLHLPHFAPRIEILGKYFEPELLESLTPYEKDQLVEVYAQLGSLLREFLHWKSLLLTSNLASDKAMYREVSSALLSHIDPLMRNMLEFWITLVRKFGMSLNYPQIQELTRLISDEIERGKWIRASYKASYFRRKEFENLERFDIVLCWINDWADCPKKVVELRELVSLHTN